MQAVHADKQKLINEIKGHIIFIVKNLVTYPDEVTVTHEQRSGAIVYTIQTEISDVGKVLGRKGKTVQGLRIICRAIAAKNDMMVEIEVVED